MKLLMDSDCLIKLTKAGLKSLVAREFSISILEVVKGEVVDAGKEKGCADAHIVEKNIEAHIIKIVETSSDYQTGDGGILAHFNKKDYDAVATDDTKLIRLLRINGIPCIVPALIIYRLFQDRTIDRKTTLGALDKLAVFVSDDEYSAVKLLMEKIK